MLKLDEVLARIEKWPKQNGLEGWSWSDFEAILLPELTEHMPLVLEKMELNKNLVNELEVRFGFTIESLEQLWNVTK